jgi:hypothetical protein|tara:strand:+ start:1854 stop:2045 length:192 start_codon:yes stop_codon:yes gene_type:complete
MSKPTHISELVDIYLNRIIRKKSEFSKRIQKLDELETKYGKDVTVKDLTEQELIDWIKLFNKK